MMAWKKPRCLPHIRSLSTVGFGLVLGCLGFFLVGAACIIECISPRKIVFLKIANMLNWRHVNLTFSLDFFLFPTTFSCPLAEKQANRSMAWLYCTTVQQFLYTVSFYNLRHDNDFCYKFFHKYSCWWMMHLFKHQWTNKVIHGWLTTLNKYHFTQQLSIVPYQCNYMPGPIIPINGLFYIHCALYLKLFRGPAFV